MKLTVRMALAFVVLLAARPALALQMGKVDYSKATAKVVRLRGNVSVIQVRAGDSLSNIGLLTGPDGYLLVDHPEPASHAVIQEALDGLGKRAVRFLVNTHWHYDHVGGNEIFGPDAVIVAHENARKRLVTEQRPWWSPKPIGPYPERAWPRVTFKESLMIHFAGEDVEMVHYGVAHTDGDAIVYFTGANIVQTGDVFHGKGQLAEGADMEGLVGTLSAIARRINDETIVITGHGELSTRAEILEYVALLQDSIEQVRREIAAGKTDEQIQAQGLPEKWKGWPAADNMPQIPQLNHLIFVSLTHKDINM
jgi:cyclase